MRALLLTCVLGAIAELTTAQSLPTCAQTCVSLTRVKCSPSDFTCACASEPYINKLATCFWKTCNEADSHDAIWYLLSLCNDAGVPLKRVEEASAKDNDNGEEADDYFSPSPRLELRRDASGYLEQRQIASFITNPTTTSTDVDIFPSATPTSPGSLDNITSITGTRGSHATTVGVQIGLGVSIGLLSLAACVWLGVWFLRERKKEKVAMTAGQTGQAGLVPYSDEGAGAGIGQSGIAQTQPIPAASGGEYKQPYTTTPAPTELSQNAQYSGHEMATHGAEMGGAPLQNHHAGGYSNAATPIQQVQQQYRKADNPVHQSQQQQVYHEVPGQHATPGQLQQTHHAAEVPGRSATPNLYE